MLHKTIFIILLWLLPALGFAHSPAVCKTVIRQDDDTHKWYILVYFNADGIISSLENETPALKNNYKNDLIWKEAFVRYVKKHLKVASSNGNLRIGNGLINIGSNFEAILELERAPKNPEFFEVENSGLLEIYPYQTNIVTVLKGQQTFEAVITKADTKQTIYLNHSLKNQIKVFFQFLKQGFKHVLPLGLDHILFITSLFFFKSDLKSSILQASMFTLAHSVTLIVTGLGYLSPNTAIVEPIIAASIFLMAIENLISHQINKIRLGLIFLFGLIHGLGFARAFLDLQVPKAMMMNALISFNIGIETAQILIIVGLYYLLAKWFRHKQWYQKYFVKSSSILISATALIWTIQRIINM